MRIVSYLLASILGFLGVIFLVGNQAQLLRIIVGIVLLLAAVAIIYLTRIQPKASERTLIQKIDLSGDMNIEEIRCRSCNAPLSKEEIEVRAGAIFVHCDHCGATYQFEEAPKW